MTLYQIVMMENKETGDKEIVATGDDERLKQKTTQLMELGYVMTGFFNTFDKTVFLENKCKFAVQRLKEESYNGSQLLVRLYDESANKKVILNTEEMVNSNLEMSIKQVGRLYSRYLSSCTDDHEPTYSDELAIQCYNYRQSRMRINSLLAEDTYSKAPHEC